MFNLQCTFKKGKHVNVNCLQVYGMISISLSRLTFIYHCNVMFSCHDYQVWIVCCFMAFGICPASSNLSFVKVL